MKLGCCLCIIASFLSFLDQKRLRPNSFWLCAFAKYPSFNDTASAAIAVHASPTAYGRFWHGWVIRWQRSDQVLKREEGCVSFCGRSVLLLGLLSLLLVLFVRSWIHNPDLIKFSNSLPKHQKPTRIHWCQTRCVRVPHATYNRRLVLAFVNFFNCKCFQVEHKYCSRLTTDSKVLAIRRNPEIAVCWRHYQIPLFNCSNLFQSLEVSNFDEMVSAKRVYMLSVCWKLAALYFASMNVLNRLHQFHLGWRPNFDVASFMTCD